MEEITTKVSALRNLLLDNGWIATWEIIYNEIEKYYPKIKNPKDWQAALRGTLYREIYKNEHFKKIDEWIFALVEYDEMKLWLNDGNGITEKNTSKEIITTIRLWQAEFRKKLLLSLKKCPITWINDSRILQASHIKPWVMSDDKERLDIYNGFLLSPTFDKLFDKWMITFDFSKRILISPSIDAYNKTLLWISEHQTIKDLPLEGREHYLEYHHHKIFLKN